MKTLVTTQSFKFGQENILPFIGKVRISQTGTIEVEDHLAQKVVDSNCGFDYADNQEQTTTTTTVESTTTTTQQQTTTTTTVLVDETTTTTTTPLETQQQDDLGKQEKDDLGKQDNQDDLSNENATTTTTVVEENTSIDTSFDIEAAKKELDNNTLAELKDMAKDFPSAEWRTLNKAELIEYLVGKIKS